MKGKRVSVRVVRVVDAGPQRVWEVIGDFGALDRWHPWVPNCRLDPGGTRRTIDLGETRAVEVLDLDASGEWSQVYTVETSPMPIEDYRAVLRLDALDEDATRITWESSFLPSHPSAEEQVRSFYVRGLESVDAEL